MEEFESSAANIMLTKAQQKFSHLNAQAVVREKDPVGKEIS